MKKTLLSLSTLAVISTPIIAVVSCAKEEPNSGQNSDNATNLDRNQEELQQQEAKIIEDFNKFDDDIKTQSLAAVAPMVALNASLDEQELIDLGLAIPQSTSGVTRSYKVKEINELSGVVKIKVTIGEQKDLQKTAYLTIDNFKRLTEKEYKVKQIGNTLNSFLSPIGSKLDDQTLNSVSTLLYEVIKGGLKEVDLASIIALFDLKIPEEVVTFLENILSTNLLPRVIDGGFVDFGINENEAELSALLNAFGQIMPLPIAPEMTSHFLQGLLHGFENGLALKDVITELLINLKLFDQTNELLELALTTISQTIYEQIPLFQKGIIHASSADWRATILFDYGQIFELINLIPQAQNQLDLQQVKVKIQNLQNWVIDNPSLFDELTGLINTFLTKGLSGLNEHQVAVFANLIDLSLTASTDDQVVLNLETLTQEVNSQNIVYQLITSLINNKDAIISLVTNGLSDDDYATTIAGIAHLAAPIVHRVMSLPSFINNSLLESMINQVITSLRSIVFADIDAIEDPAPSLDAEAQIWAAEKAKFTSEIKNQTLSSQQDLPQLGEQLSAEELANIGITIPELEANVTHEYLVTAINYVEGSMSLQVKININENVEKILTLTINGFKKMTMSEYQHQQLVKLLEDLLTLTNLDLPNEQKDVLLKNLELILTQGIKNISPQAVAEIFAAFNLPTATSELLTSALNSEILQKLLVDGFGNLISDENKAEFKQLIASLQASAPVDIKPFLSEELITGIFKGFKSVSDLTDALWSALEKGGFLADLNWLTEKAAYLGMLAAFATVWNGVPVLHTGIINASPEDWIASITYNWDTIIDVIKWVPSFKAFLMPPEANGYSDFENLQRILKWLKDVDQEQVDGQSGLINIATGLTNILQNGIDDLTLVQLQEITNLVSWSINYGPDHPEALTPDDIHQVINQDNEDLYSLLVFITYHAESINQFVNQGLGGPHSEVLWNDLKSIITNLLTVNLNYDLTTNTFVNEFIDNLLEELYQLFNVENTTKLELAESTSANLIYN